MSNTDTSAWGTTSRNDPMRPSLVARAKKRKTKRVTKNGWLIDGNSSLGDSRDSYLVHRNEDGTFRCECHTNDYGDVRSVKGCSHVTGVLLWLDRYGDVWDDGDDVEEPEEDQTEPDADTQADEEGAEETEPLPDPDVDEEDPAGDEGGEVVKEGVEVQPATFNRFTLDPFHPPLPSEVVGTRDVALDPEKFPAYRDPQWEAICEAVELFRDGFKVVFIDAPTGAGKTLLAESVRRILDSKGIYTCLTPDSLVRTPQGYVPISEVRPGDSVIGIDGSPVSVKSSIPKHHQGKVLEITTAHKGESIKVTPDHLIQVVSRASSGDGWVPVAKLGQEERRWVRADELRHGSHFRDYMVWPIRSTESEVVEDAWVATLGWYVAEGYTGADTKGVRYQTMFSLGSHEQDLVDDLLIHLADQDYSPSVRNGGTNTLVVTVNSVELARRLESECGRHAPNKRLPGWVMNLPRRQRQLLLDTLVLGDGSFNGRHCQYATTSQQLALQVRELALSLGFVAGVTRSPIRNTVIDGRTIHGRHELLNVRWDTKPIHPHGYIDDDVVYLPVVDVVEHDYNGLVYDIEVPEGSAFCTVAGIAHNCTTKSLQAQTMRDFGYFAKLLKGRKNYPTLDHPEAFPSVTAQDCTRRKTSLPACEGCVGWDPTRSGWDVVLEQEDEGTYHCNNCHPSHRCPYESAKWEAKRAQLAVLNTAYLMTEANYARGLFSGWPLVIMDEADMLEELLFGFVEFEITPLVRRTIGVTTLPKKTVPEDWVRWLGEEIHPAILTHMGKLRGGQATLNLDMGGDPVAKRQKEFDRYAQMAGRIRYLVTPREYQTDHGEVEVRTELEKGWVLTGFKTKGRGKTDDPAKSSVVFKPIKVDRDAPDVLWRHGEKFLLLSASWVSVEQEAENLGLKEGEWAHVEMPSSFPAESRPIVVETVAEVTAKNKEVAYPALEREVLRLLEKHPDDRILVHTVSYELTDRLVQYVKRRVGDPTRVFTYKAAWERDDALAGYLDHPNGVIFAPSFDRGVDLHEDDCRVQIIAKVPWPYLGDEQVAARANGTGRSGKIWYAVKTIRTIIQMTGRGMRSKDDSVVTYILDKTFVRLYQQNRRLFPKWWTDALVWDTNEPKWRWLK